MVQKYHHKDMISHVYSEPGIYRLCLKTAPGYRIVYIGQSINVKKRLMTHRRTSYIAFDFFSLKYCPRTKLDEIENLALEEFKEKYGRWPIYNNQGGNKDNSYSNL